MITEKIKRILTFVLAVLTLSATLLFTVSCDDDSGDTDTERYGEGASDIEIANFDYGFIEAENYDDRNTTIADTKRSTQLSADTVYYCMIEFDVAAKKLNDGTSLVNVLVKFDNLGVANGTTEEAGTGNATEIRFTDATTGTDSKVSTLAYKIPPDPDKPKKIKILIRMQPVSIGESHISVAFESQLAGEFKVLGEDGFTKNLEVVRAQLEAPVITVDRETMRVKWTHVKNADYYIIFFNDKTITFTSVDEYTAVGSELSFDLFEFAGLGESYGDVKIQACNNSTNFIKSQYSNIEADVLL